MERDEIKAERTAIYGDPEDAHACIGMAWTAILKANNPGSDILIGPRVVALMMASLKIVRAARPYKRDEDAYDDAMNYVQYAREFDGRDR